VKPVELLLVGPDEGILNKLLPLPIELDDKSPKILEKEDAAFGDDNDDAGDLGLLLPLAGTAAGFGAPKLKVCPRVADADFGDLGASPKFSGFLANKPANGFGAGFSSSASFSGLFSCLCDGGDLLLLLARRGDLDLDAPRLGDAETLLRIPAADPAADLRTTTKRLRL
jgi:hypothetical protein